MQHQRIWREDRLVLFKTHLAEAWKGRYEELVAECGEPEHPELAGELDARVRVSHGPGEDRLNRSQEKVRPFEVERFFLMSLHLVKTILFKKATGFAEPLHRGG
ncbi:MAG: hypothetical protein FJY81_04560 [Candidatus Aminicenantes bacterium]|nr:hypothetical protein [Candidatus Aminicenantes bacterium]